MQLNSPILENLRKSARNLVREFGFFRTHYADTEATHGETHVLIELQRLGALEVGEIGRILNMEKTSASKLLSQMEKKKWVSSQNGLDGRKRIFGLSAIGEKITKEITVTASTRMELALRELPKTELTNVERSLALLSEALKVSRARSQFIIRECRPKDDKAVATIVKRSLKDVGFDGPGTAAADPSVNHLSSFNDIRSTYLVAEFHGRIMGGVGITSMKGESKNVCELIRMFLHPEARSTGLAQILIEEVLARAKQYGYEICYLETTEAMSAAQRLYVKNGFHYVRQRRGNTWHFACNVLMEKRL